MTVREFVTKYNFHDSLVETVYYDEKQAKVKMHIDFAFWMQDWYTDEMPETDVITIVFDDVCSFECPSDVVWDQVSIIAVSSESECIKIALINDFTDEYMDIFVKCVSVSVTNHIE